MEKFNKADYKTRMNLNKFVKYIILLAFSYIYIYSPYIYGIKGSISFYLIPIVYFYILINKKAYVFLYFKKEYLILIILFFFTLFYDLFSGELTYLPHSIYYIFELIPFSIFIVTFFNKNFKDREFINFLIIIAVIASLISITLFLFNDINELIRSNVLLTSEKAENYYFRGFGISSNLFFGMPIVQGLIAAICLIKSKKRSFYLYPIPFLILSILINARIGLIPLLIAFLLLTFSIKSYYKQFFSFAFILLIVVVLFVNSPYLEQYRTTSLWTINFFFNITDYIFHTNLSLTSQQVLGTKYVQILNSSSQLFSNIVLPKDFWGWVWGLNENIFGRLYNHSDIGYLIQLNYGGIIFLSLIFILFFFLFVKIKKYNNISGNFNKILLASFIILNLKGDLYYVTPAIRLLILLTVYFTIRYLGRKKNDFNYYNNL